MQPVLTLSYHYRIALAIARLLFVALVLGGGLALAMAAPGNAQTTAEPFKVEASAIHYPKITVTVTQVMSLEVSDALKDGLFTVCEDDRRPCQPVTSAVAVDAVQPYHILIVLDKSLPEENLTAWTAFTNSIASLIKAMGSEDQIAILPFSRNLDTQTEWTSDKTDALAHLNGIAPDSTKTALNLALKQALMTGTVNIPTDTIRIVIIADRLDNTLNAITMTNQLTNTLIDADNMGIPIDLYCYGPVVANPLLDQLRLLIEQTGGRLETPNTAVELEALLQPVHAFLNAFPQTFTFDYQSQLPSGGGEHQLAVTLDDPIVFALGTFSIAQQTIPLTLTLLNPTQPLTDHVELAWDAGDRVLSATVAAWPLDISTIQYKIAINDQTAAPYGPFAKGEAFVNLKLSVPKDVAAKAATALITATVTDKNGNTGTRTTTLSVQPPPVFELSLQPSSVVTAGERVTVSIVNRYGITNTDQITITDGDPPNASVMAVTNTHVIPVSVVTFASSFFSDTEKVLAETWRHLQANARYGRLPDQPESVKACLAGEICRQASYSVRPLSLAETWRRFGRVWWPRIQPWLIAMAIVWLLIGLLWRMRRMSTLEIPVKVQNRGLLALPCYLQVQEAAVPTRKSWQWLRRVFRQAPTKGQPAGQMSAALPTELPDQGPLVLVLPPNVRFNVLQAEEQLAFTTSSHPQPAGISRARRSAPSRATIQNYSKWLRLSPSRVQSAWGWPQSVARRIGLLWVGNRLKSLWRGTADLFGWAALNSRRDKTFRQNFVASGSQVDWVRTKPIQPGEFAELILRVESMIWHQRKRVRLLVRSSPDGIADVCEYDLEIGLGAFWWQRPFAVIKPKCP